MLFFEWRSKCCFLRHFFFRGAKNPSRKKMLSFEWRAKTQMLFFWWRILKNVKKIQNFYFSYSRHSGAKNIFFCMVRIH